MRAHLRDIRNIVRDFFGDIGTIKPRHGDALRRTIKDASGFAVRNSSSASSFSPDAKLIRDAGEAYDRSFDRD